MAIILLSATTLLDVYLSEMLPSALRGSIWCNAALSSSSQKRVMQFMDPDDLQISSDILMIIHKIFALGLSRTGGKITKNCVSKLFQTVSDDTGR